ncbi:hypothetical protein RvY_12764 [Ramazzottius varieornatus]|uniref:Secreted protein n=1 Tax=Ramazzottius varieornatus TaxID=947166 RepID=A0A1D1VKM5_RAMVA|nr:hypothetical protein RvY_12764 [Ramazzottius varieornatus]
MKFLVVLAALVTLVAADFVRVEFKLLEYSNNAGKGLLATGERCEKNRHCDPVMTGYVDTEKPLNAWPGPKADPKTWTSIFDVKDSDFVKVGKIVSRDVCDADYTKANLRAEVSDTNRFTSDKKINQFECLSGRDVARNEASASWSAPKQCDAKFNPTKVGLTYQWRAFEVSNAACGAAIGKTGPAKKPSSGIFG